MKPETLPAFAQNLAAFIARLQLSETRAAALLGVPVHTLRKWLNGTRCPGGATARLVAVLETLEVLAPAILAGLTPDAPAPVAHVRKLRKKSDAHVEPLQTDSLGAETPL